jgi:hypothetical protein
MLLKLLSRVVDPGLPVVVVGPAWPTAPWWPLVMARPTLELGLVANYIKPGQSNVGHPFGYACEPAAAEQQFMLGWVLNM